MMVCHLSHHHLLSANLTLSPPPLSIPPPPLIPSSPSLPPSPSFPLVPSSPPPLVPPPSSLPPPPFPLLPSPLLSLPTALQNVVLVWREVVEELRYRWENGHIIPKLVANRSVPLCPVCVTQHGPSLPAACLRDPPTLRRACSTSGYRYSCLRPIPERTSELACPLPILESHSHSPTTPPPPLPIPPYLSP